MSEFAGMVREGRERYGARWESVTSDIRLICRSYGVDADSEPQRLVLAKIALSWCRDALAWERKLELAQGHLAAAIEERPPWADPTPPSSWEPPERRHVSLDKGAPERGEHVGQSTDVDLGGTLSPRSAPDGEQP